MIMFICLHLHDDGAPIYVAVRHIVCFVSDAAGAIVLTTAGTRHHVSEAATEIADIMDPPIPRGRAPDVGTGPSFIGGGWAGSPG